MTEMDIPLLVPHAVQRKGSDGRHHSREVGLTEGAKAVLRPGVDVRIPRVHRHAESIEHQVSREVSLIEHVHMGICAQTAAVVEEARLRIQLVLQAGVDAVLDLLESSRIGYVIDARGVGEHLLAHFLRTQKAGDETQLRDVRSNGLAWIAPAEQQSRRDMAIAISRAGIAGHAGKFLSSLSSSPI